MRAVRSAVLDANNRCKELLDLMCGGWGVVWMGSIVPFTSMEKHFWGNLECPVNLLGFFCCSFISSFWTILKPRNTPESISLKRHPSHPDCSKVSRNPLFPRVIPNKHKRFSQNSSPKVYKIPPLAGKRDNLKISRFPENEKVSPLLFF